MLRSRWQCLIAIVFSLSAVTAFADDASEMQRLLLNLKFLSTPTPHCWQPATSAAPKIDSAACKSHLAAWDSAMASAKPVDDVIAKIKTKSPQIILIGEDHYASSANYYPKLIHKLKAALPDLDCLFLEFSPQSKMNVMAMMQGRNNLVRDPRVFESKAMIDAATKEKIRLVFADRNSRTPGWEWIHGMWLDINSLADGNIVDRNKGFADVIHSQLANGSCKRGALIIGKGHITEELGRHYKTLPEMLRDQKVKTSAITMIGTADGMFGKIDQFFWNECASNPKPPKDAVGIAIEGPFAKQPDSRTFGGRMSDFDFAIVTPPVPYKTQVPPGYQRPY